MQITLYAYGVDDIIRRLGQTHHVGGGETSLPWRLRHIGGLISSSNFPAPIPLPLLRRTSALAVAQDKGIHARSRWQTQAVDNWFDGLLSCGAVENDTSAQMAAAASDMDNRAFGLRLVAGGRS